MVHLEEEEGMLSSGCGRCVSEKLVMNEPIVCLIEIDFLGPYFGHTNTPRGSVCLLNNTRQEKGTKSFQECSSGVATGNCTRILLLL